MHPTAWQFSSVAVIQRLRGLACGSEGHGDIRVEVAMSDEEPFSEFVQGNRNTLVAELSVSLAFIYRHMVLLSHNQCSIIFK